MSDVDKLNIRKSISSYKDYVNELVVDSIIKPVGKGKSKESWAEKFLSKYLNTALSDPNSKAANFMATVLIKDNALSLFDELKARQILSNRDFTLYKIRKVLYDKQQEVFDSVTLKGESNYKKHVIINSRRSGKTHLMGHLIVAALLEPDAHVIYLNRTSSAAIRQIRSPLKIALEQTDLTIIQGSVDAQELHFSNGSQLLILGNNNSADVDRTRGERISCCILDECGHQRNMQQLLKEVIDPALKDYGKDARLIMVGTPPRIPHTYIEDVWEHAESRGWKRWHWTFMDNPFIPDRDKVIEEVCKEFGVLPDAAFVRREYFGEMNVYDTEAQVFYGFVKGKAPDIQFTHAYIGVDWGFEDKAAIVAIVADSKTKKAYIVKDWSMSKQSISTICEKVVEMRKYLLDNFKIVNAIQVICDTNEKSAVYELTQTYKLPNVTMAYKYDKDLAIEQLAEWLRAGTITTSEAATNSIEDFENTLWERDEETDKLAHTIDDDLYHPNAAMAILYCSRQFDYDCMVTGYSKTAKDIIDEFLTK